MGAAAVRTAPVVLEVVNTPLGKGVSVELFVPVRAERFTRVAGVDHGASSTPGAQAQAELQPARVNLAPKGHHARRKPFGVAAQAAIEVSMKRLPAIIDHHVLIAGIAHAS